MIIHILCASMFVLSDFLKGSQRNPEKKNRGFRGQKNAERS